MTGLNLTAGLQGTSLSLVVQGANLSGANLALSPATGITINALQATASSVTATIDIAADAAIGGRQITAINAGGVSNALTFTVTCPPPAAPTDVRGAVSGTFLFLTWTAVSNATTYVLEIGPGAGQTSITRETTPGTSSIGAVLASGNYFARVRSKNACDLGPPSTEFQVQIR